MGFWKNNPSEPCCNPPAGYCQCQPCRWKVTEVQGYDPVYSVANPDLTTSDYDYFAEVGLPHSLAGYVSHQLLRINRANIDAPGEGPPWLRLWQAAVDYPDGPAHPNNDAGNPTPFSRWYFGFYNWFYDNGIGGAPNVHEEQVSWGLGINLYAEGPRLLKHGYPTTGDSITADEMWWLIPGYNLPGWENRWNCWGPNKLLAIENGKLFTFGPEPSRYVIVEPDV